ncbi:methionyl-tRNA formyltransferase [Candidatus Daviesbacteria bacterium]|nr:methionyl-tRNA formyltransferase [Candidatus Daviesbacteria bacterium]
MKINIVFFGNTKYSILGAQIIHQKYPLSLVVTIPEKFVGRKKELMPSPVKIMAQNLRIPVLEADKLSEEIIKKIAKLKPDFLVVEDYGLILPQKLLDFPKFTGLNIHHSLLPKYRGPSPAPTTILNGDKISGVTIIAMSGEVDAGDILAQESYTLMPAETTETLLTKLNTLGGELLTKVIDQFLNNTISAIKQDSSQASFTSLIKKQDGYFNIENPPSKEVLDRMIRAYYPWPNVWTLFRQGSRGQAKIIKFYPDGMVQMEGKSKVKLPDFLNGYPNFPIREF